MKKIIVSLVSLIKRSQKSLHPQFKVTEGIWSHNRHYSTFDGIVNCKIQLFFDNLSLMDNCPFMAKIGINTDEQISATYIAFCYGNGKTREELMQYAKKFPRATIIDGLNANGTIHEHSMIHTLTPKEYPRKVLVV